jgi:hypothetical protein
MTTHLTVMVFPGTQTLPLFAAQACGFFAKRGLTIDLKPAPNSEEQRKGLAEGRYPIVHGAADQCVALVEAGTDAIIVAGGDNGFNHLFVQPEIASIADLRGKTLVADVATPAGRSCCTKFSAGTDCTVTTILSTRPARRSAASRRCETTRRWRPRSSTRRLRSMPGGPD